MTPTAHERRPTPAAAHTRQAEHTQLLAAFVMQNATSWLRPLHVVATYNPGVHKGDHLGKWTSTSGQDRTVAALLGRGEERFFIELGAFAPIDGSNTRALERDLGWRGICIEPSAKLHAGLLAIRKCEVVGAAVSDEETTAGLIEAGQGSQLFKLDDHRRSSTTTAVSTIRLSRILSYFHAPPRIDYFSLDVEGHEERVMASFPFEKHRISLLTVERPSGRLQSTLRAKGYEYVCDHGHYGDQLWVDASMSTLLQRAKRNAVACTSKATKMRTLRCEPIGNPAWTCGPGKLRLLKDGVGALARRASARLGHFTHG